jgi:hypothetical protein
MVRVVLRQWRRGAGSQRKKPLAGKNLELFEAKIGKATRNDISNLKAWLEPPCFELISQSELFASKPHTAAALIT